LFLFFVCFCNERQANIKKWRDLLLVVVVLFLCIIFIIIIKLLNDETCNWLSGSLELHSRQEYKNSTNNTQKRINQNKNIK